MTVDTQGNGGTPSAFRAKSAWIPLLMSGAATALKVTVAPVLASGAR